MQCDLSKERLKMIDNLNLENRNQFAGMSNNRKGYRYEMKLQNLLSDNKFEYLGNPTDFEEWKKHTKTGYDIIIKNPRDGNWITIECKFILKSIYPSWLLRDWIGRSATIIVTNDPYILSYKQRKMLKENGKKLFSTMEFLFYIQKLANGNKYNLNSRVYSYKNDISSHNRLNNTEKSSLNTPYFSSDNVPNKEYSKQKPNPYPKLSKEEERAAMQKMFEKYPDFTLCTSNYCRYCTSQCRLYHELKTLRKNKIDGVQATISTKMRIQEDYEECKTELQLNKEKRRRKILKLLTECTKCANQRLYKYEVLGYKSHFDSTIENHDNPQKPKRRIENKSSEDCRHRIHIKCTSRREPIDFCILSISAGQIRQEILDYLKNGNCQCDCNEIVKKFCPYENSCEKIVESNRCPETIQGSFSQIPTIHH